MREVEVSIWEAIHAAQQYIGLSGDITRGGQKYIDLEDAQGRGQVFNLDQAFLLIETDTNNFFDSYFIVARPPWIPAKSMRE